MDLKKEPMMKTVHECPKCNGKGWIRSGRNDFLIGNSGWVTLITVIMLTVLGAVALFGNML